MSIGQLAPPQRGRSLAYKWLARLCSLLALLLAAGCATPIGVDRADPQSVHRELTGNVLSTGELSDFTQNVLRIGGMAEVAESDPATALAAIHEAVITGMAGPNALFAYAELAFKHASEGGGRPYYLASAVYAFAYLFPDDGTEAPSPFDPRYRWAVDLYNLALTTAFETAGGTRVELRPGVYELPFGRLDVAFDQDRLVWGDLRLTEFAPAAELEVRGLRNRYRRPGLGAPLAAAATPLKPIEGFQVAARQRAPVTVILRIEDARRALADGQLHGNLELYTPTDPEAMTRHVLAWLDERLDLSGLRAFLAEKSVPRHRHSVWYYMGGITLFLVGVQVATGVLLLLYYRPSASEAYESVQFIVSQVEFGWLIRNLHSWSANLLILMAFVHLFSTFFLRSYRKPRELTWITRRAAALRDDGLRLQRLPAAVERAGVLRDQGRNRHCRRGPGRRRLHGAFPARRR